MRAKVWRWLVLACVLACASPAATAPRETDAPATPSPPTVTPTPSAAASAAPARPHVFVIVMENASLARAIAAPDIATLASTYRVAMNYHAVARPSLPNYLALTSGSTWGVTDDDYHVLPAGGLGAQLSAAGVPWRAYMEGLSSDGCVRSPDPHAGQHNPFAYYGGGGPPNDVVPHAPRAGPPGDPP